MSQRNKRVRISDESPSIVVRSAPLSDQERVESFWSATDFAAVRDEVKQECREHRRKRRYSECLTEAYLSACSSSLATGDEGLVPESPRDSDSEDPEPDKDFIRLLADDGPRGLEGYSSRLHAIRKQRHLQDAKHAVFLEQARQVTWNEPDPELLARQCAKASCKARSFAALLGQVDALAAKTDKEGSGSSEEAESPKTESKEELPPT